MKRLKIFPILFAVFILSTVPAIVVAQDEEAQPAARKRLEEYRKVKLIEAIKLSDDQMVKLLNREKEFRATQHQSGNARREAVARLKTLLDKKASDDELMKEMLNIERIRAEMLGRHKDFVLSLRDFMTTRQVAEYLVFEEAFMKDVRNLLNDMRQHRQDHDKD